MGVARSTWCAASPAWCRAPATPARTGSRSRVPAERAVDLADAAAGAARGGARRPRRARLAAAGGRALPVRQRHRRTHHAGRGRPDLGDRQAPQRGMGLPRRGGRSATSSTHGAAAAARRHPPGRPCPGPRRRHIVADDGTEAGTITSGGFGPTPERADRHGLRPPRPGRRRGNICRCWCAARLCPPPSCRCRLSPTATYAEGISQRWPTPTPATPGPRMGPPRRRHRHRRHHRPRTGGAGRRGVRRAAGAWTARWRPARPAPWWKA